MARAETRSKASGLPAESSVKSSPHELRGLVLALVAFLAVFGLKLTAYFVTGYMSLFAEALHTLSDIVITGLLLAAAVWSRRRADATYVFGYGRAQNIAALVAAVLLISFTSYKLFEEAVPALFGPEPSNFHNVNLALGIIGASLAISLAPFLLLQRQESKGASAKAQLVELTSDVLGLVAAFAGTLIATEVNGYADPRASLVVAVIIALNAFGLARANVSLLLGRSPGETVASRAPFQNVGRLSATSASKSNPKRVRASCLTRRK